MRKIIPSFGAVLVAALTLSGCVGQPDGSPTSPKGTVVSEVVHSRSLEGNLLNDTPDRAVTIYLPPSYGSGNRRYPVLYLLHGFGSTQAIWGGELSAPGPGMTLADVPKLMDRLVGSIGFQEMIVVMPDASNRFGGSFYTNSVTTGNWEDFVVHDLVESIDGRYRTLRRPESRGIAGHSMGGHGAFKLAMKHPEVFGSVYALSACCLEWDNAWSADNPAWQRALAVQTVEDWKRLRHEVATGDRKAPEWFPSFIATTDFAIAAAFSPDPGRPPFFAALPIETRGGDRGPNGAVEAEWNASLPIPMLSQYRSNLALLRGIAFDIGNQDFNPHLPVQARDLDRALTRNAIAHEFEEYAGTHTDKIAERLRLRVIPFFSRTLKGEG